MAAVEEFQSHSTDGGSGRVYSHLTDGGSGRVSFSFNRWRQWKSFNLIQQMAAVCLGYFESLILLRIFVHKIINGDLCSTAVGPFPPGN